MALTTNADPPRRDARLKANRGIGSLTPAEMSAVVLHPAQRATTVRIAELIGWLRACEQPADYFEFQRQLFGDLYKVEERRGQCSRIIKRFRAGRKLPADAPPPPHSGDPEQLTSWELEAFVYERLGRQLRTVGDGFAWRCFGFDRRIILTLCRNDSPGMMYGKEGLPYELGKVEELWRQESHFALLHDLTNCLRIADLTEFTDDGGCLLREIKAKPHTEKKQLDRAEAAINALMHGGSLPGPRPDARLVKLTEPYATNLKQLGDLLALAVQHGCRGMKLSGGRALTGASAPALIRRWGQDHEAARLALESVRARAIRRAGIDQAAYHLSAKSGDSAARAPIMAPWSIYPLPPGYCAAVICDLLTFETVLSADQLVATLEAAGLRTEYLLRPPDIRPSLDLPVLRMHRGDRALTLHTYGLNLLLYELVEPETWARGMREALTIADPPTEPVLIFADEAGTWT